MAATKGATCTCGRRLGAKFWRAILYRAQQQEEEEEAEEEAAAEQQHQQCEKRQQHLVASKARLLMAGQKRTLDEMSGLASAAPSATAAPSAAPSATAAPSAAPSATAAPTVLGADEALRLRRIDGAEISAIRNLLKGRGLSGKGKHDELMERVKANIAIFTEEDLTAAWIPFVPVFSSKSMKAHIRMLKKSAQH